MYSSIYRVQSSTRGLPIRALFGFTSPLPLRASVWWFVLGIHLGSPHFWRQYLEIFNINLEFYSNHRHRATECFTSPIWELATLHIQCMVITAKLTMFSTHLRRYCNTYHPIGIFIGPRTESHVLSELGNEGARELYKRHCVSSTQSMVAHIGYK